MQPRLTRARRRRALVIGGSMGGLFAANLLLRAGWNVDVFERVGAALAGRGAGIATHDELFRALDRAGIVIDETIGVEVCSRVALDRAGNVIAERSLRQIMTAWGRIYRLLKDALPAARCHFNRSLESVEQDGQTVVARFADGTSASGDLLIGADGIRSTVRAQFLPQAKPVYAGYVAWRGLVNEKNLSARSHQALFDRFGFCLPPGEQVLGYPVAGIRNTTTPGNRRYNFVWYRPADEKTELATLLTDSSGLRHDMTIPPDRIREDVIVRMRLAADKLLAPQFADIVHAVSRPFFQAIYDLESTRVVFGRVAIIGDAAFVARPHAGMGVTKAAGDAVVLVDELARTPEDLDLALRAFEEKRVRYGRAIVAHARGLGAGIGAFDPKGDEHEMAAQLRIPEVVLREVAVAPEVK